MTQAMPEQSDRVTRVALTEMPPSHEFISNSVPVGVAGFALTTFTLGLSTTGMFSAKLTILVLPLAAFYGGLTQWIAGWFALRRGDLFAACFMTTYGAFWWSYVALILYVVPRVGTAAGEITTIFLIMWTVITIIFTIASAGTNWFVLFTFIEFDITLIVAFIGTGIPSVPITHAAGYLEIILGAMGWYIVMAELVNETMKRTVFPLFPFKKSLIPPLNTELAGRS
jgi:uncharacterized protein